MDVVESVNNSAGKRHGDLREWLGLEPGKILDPKEFDVEGAYEALEGLR